MSHLLESARIGRAFAELIVIVVGILLALWADSWMADRKAERQEAVYLQGLRSEFVTLTGDIDEQAARLDDWLDDLTKIANPALRSSATRESLDLWIGRGLFQVNDFDPRHAVLDDLRSTGQVVLLASDQLRQLLADHVRMLAELEELQEELRGVQFDRLDPFLVAHADVGQAARAMGVEQSVPLDDWDAQPLLDAPELQNLANLKIMTLSFLAEEVQALRANTEAVIATIDALVDD